MHIHINELDRHDMRIINAINYIKEHEGFKTTKECIKWLALDKIKKIKRMGV